MKTGRLTEYRSVNWRHTPRLIQLVLRDRNGVTLDAVDLTTPDPSNGVIELTYGEKAGHRFTRGSGARGGYWWCYVDTRFKQQTTGESSNLTRTM